MTLLAGAIDAFAGPEQAIVGIYATLGAGRSEMGTGFFTSRDGTIVTAYHVIRGATKIRVVTAQGSVHEDIRIASLAPDRDLAVLEILSRPATSTFFALIDRVPQPSEELTVIGYPRGLPRQVIRARSTSTRLISSLALRDSRGRRVFASDIEVLPLDSTIYSGMSGAPIFGADGAVGVLSGSFEEGGTLAWMIPVMHLKTGLRVNKRPSEITTWPPFELMGSTFRSLSRRFVIDQRGEKILESFLQSIDRLSEGGQRIGQTALKLEAQIRLVRPILQMVLTDPTIARDAKTAMSFLDIPVETLFAAVEPYGEAHTAFAEASVELVNRGTELVLWAEELARSDPEAARIAQAINQRLKGADSRGYYKRIGSTPELITQGVTELVKASGRIDGFSPSNVRDFAQTILTVLQSWEPEIKRHGSSEAIRVMREHVDQFRGFLAAFEPLVYRQ